jgi:predicted N-acetyltransferase YhbS
MEIHIRKEEKADQHLVEAITRQAFYNQEDFRKKGYGCSEHYMVHLLRTKDGIMDLNLVAEVGHEIVGHIIYSKSKIITENQQTIQTITLGPVSVKKSLQNQGIGTYLINQSIELAKSLGYGAIIIYGHPNYYPRFGFVPASQYHITTPEGDNYDAFMALELIPGYLSNIKGKCLMSDIFNEEAYKNQIIDFDSNFK